MKSFIIASTGSSAGKTTISLGIMEALRRRGLSVQPFKAGPDYIDPGHHRALLGVPSYNLDTWMMGPEGVKKTFLENSRADVGVIEGVMGLHDGRDGRSEEGSTAHLAKILKVPVLLVVNAEKTARSAGAIVKGFASFDPAVEIKWVIFNRVGSPRHYSILKDSIKGLGVKAIGYLPKDAALHMPERHLGLVTAEDGEGNGWREFVSKAASLVEKHIDLKPLSGRKGKRAGFKKNFPEPSLKVGVALDRAFLFYYEENLEMLRGLGAEPVFFSPIKDKKIPEGISGLYLGGGYPELHCEALAGNKGMRDGIRKLAQKGLPILAECGGLMYLGRVIRDRNGKEYPMAGLFPWKARMLERRKALGYREVRLTPENPFGAKGLVRGHEFHYSEIGDPPADFKRSFRLTYGGEGTEGYVFKNTLATYMHLHFASNPAFARAFVRKCTEYGQKG